MVTCGVYGLGVTGCLIWWFSVGFCVFILVGLVFGFWFLFVDLVLVVAVFACCWWFFGVIVLGYCGFVGVVLRTFRVVGLVVVL